VAYINSHNNSSAYKSDKPVKLCYRNFLCKMCIKQQICYMYSSDIYLRMAWRQQAETWLMNYIYLYMYSRNGRVVCNWNLLIFMTFVVNFHTLVTSLNNALKIEYFKFHKRNLDVQRTACVLSMTRPPQPTKINYVFSKCVDLKFSICRCTLKINWWTTLHGWLELWRSLFCPLAGGMARI
jgi:hypothetical protein